MTDDQVNEQFCCELSNVTSAGERAQTFPAHLMWQRRLISDTRKSSIHLAFSSLSLGFVDFLKVFVLMPVSQTSYCYNLEEESSPRVWYRHQLLSEQDKVWAGSSFLLWFHLITK